LHLLGVLRDQATAPPLLELFRQLRREALASEGAIELAARAATVLGERLGSRVALEPLLEAARDPSFPAIQAAAISAAAALDCGAAADVLRAGAASEDRRVSLAARAARARCRR